jgi:uncharacterized protein YbjT (DUF2867 family)
VRVLLTGATGFVGSFLLDRLLREDHELRALVRRPERLAAAPGVEVMRGDAVTGEGLERAMHEVEVAYYLIHSMESSPGSFVERELIAAANFAAAARRAGVRRIVYLGGLLPHWDSEQPAAAGRPPVSAHLASRAAVESLLMDAVPGSLSLRASIVIGARSRSFRLLVRLVERMPLLALPAWQRFRTQPIDERDVTEMLLRCATTPISGEVLEIGGPDVLSYGDMLRAIAEAMLVGRPSLRLPFNARGLTARVAAAIASEDPELVVPLMEGLQGDLLPRDDRTAVRLGVRLHSFDSAVDHALAEWERAEPLAAR